MSKMAKKIVQFGLVLMMVFILGGCGQSAPATAKSELTPNQAAELIYHDLSFHGIDVEKINITDIAFKNRNTVLVDATYLTADGKNISQKVIIVRENGTWIIEDHNH